MTSPRVLAIFLLAAITVNTVLGMPFDNDDKLCTAARFSNGDVTADVFCMGVKRGTVSLHGTGCLVANDCEQRATAVAVTTRNDVQWRVTSTETAAPKVLLVLSKRKPLVESKVGEKYELPPNAVAFGGDNQVRLTDKEGKIVDTDPGCFSGNGSVSSPRTIDCQNNGFKADLFKDELHVTIVKMDIDGKLLGEYPLNSHEVLLGQGDVSSWPWWAWALIIIGIIILVVICGAGIIHFQLEFCRDCRDIFCPKKEPVATVTPVVAR